MPSGDIPGENKVLNVAGQGMKPDKPSLAGEETVYVLRETAPAFADADPDGGRGPGRRIFELADPVGDPLEMKQEMLAKIAEVAERVAREIIPGLAERVIRDEIEKLKRRE
jgi:hypothetical protein